MTENKQDELRQIADRNLGDEWADWAGDLSKYEKEINEGKRLFLLFYFSALFAITAVSMFFYYLIAPRIEEFHPYAGQFLLYGIIALFGAILLWSFLLLLTLAFNRDFIPVRRKSGLHIEWIYPAVYRIASMFGVSRDRIGNSLVKVNNALIYATRRQFVSRNLLVLLPRCLDKETRLKLMEITQKYGCNVFTATGGSSARNMVKKVKPDAIIGVACERDLVSGMSDSPKMVPIIAITNKRPHGPCRDTFIDVDEFEKAVRFLIKHTGDRA